ncbi:hypothetical protein EYC84_004665 [Monilinia fructicola]|uniref:Uncharacterized protein n=1 Tax=Monilinia fructicola TaxID=38448 RepID=A0A5M9K5S2_MONFR|nr:hypothetical protein EYC84_004665 [Monilinia fructicola]
MIALIRIWGGTNLAVGQGFGFVTSKMRQFRDFGMLRMPRDSPASNQEGEGQAKKSKKMDIPVEMLQYLCILHKRLAV